MLVTSNKYLFYFLVQRGTLLVLKKKGTFGPNLSLSERQTQCQAEDLHDQLGGKKGRAVE